mmetsp:Transcript_95507/g.169594  ORF Transcript_95507/g.169594 Transcript_95507/m.169594 type:complete len:440 (+) Transcript_95507:56-1375(+)
MDALLGIFEAVACVSDVVSRIEDKDHELAALAGTVKSISQSVQTFAESLDVQEREQAFNSNQVFPDLMKALADCKLVIAKYSAKAAEMVDSIKDVNGSSVAGALKNGWKNTTRTFQEGLEVLGGKFGHISGLLQLPEDELEILRKAHSELQRLLGPLQIAMQTRMMQQVQGLKRAAASELAAPDACRPRLALSDENGRGGLRAEPLEDKPPAATKVAAEEAPRLLLHLVSDEASLSSSRLSVLSTKELRPASATVWQTATSTTSLDSNGTKAEAQDAEDDGSLEVVFGRQEIRGEDKVPLSLSMPQKPGGPLEPLWRFVSRDFLLFNIPQPVAPTQDSMDMATLAFGVSESPDLLTESSSSDGRLATISGLSAQGIYFRKALQSRWRWLSKNETHAMHEGDRVAVVVRSTQQDIDTPLPQQDHEGEEVTCLLGIEIRRP